MLLDGFPLQLWPEKFQNKTNGVTPRRWLSFCNPQLSAVITKWLGSEEWVLDTEQLAGLRNVSPWKHHNALINSLVLALLYLQVRGYHGENKTPLSLD
jgi:glucan phosphorylase